MLSRTPRIGPALALALFALALATAIPASAGVGYRVTIERPEPEGPSATARGTVVVRAGVEGGVGDAEFAAYHVRPPGGSWSQASSLRMQKVGDRFFAAEEEPWETTSLVNGEYELEVRVWGEIPPYRPADPATFASQTLEVRVDNPPPAPTGLGVSAGARSFRLTWSPVATAGRADFLGYRIWRAPGPTCPGVLSAYEDIADTEGTSFASASAEPGAWCFGVTVGRPEPTGPARAPGF